VALVLMGDRTDQSGVPITNDLQAVATQVADLQPAAGRADIADALYQAVRILTRENATNPEIYLISDRQGLSWDGVNETFATGWNITRKRMNVPPRLFVIPVGGENMDNVALEAITPLSAPVIRDVEMELELRIRNYGSLQRSALPLTITAAGREILKTTINLPPDSASAIKVPVRFPTSGSQIVTARVTTTAYTMDDTVHAAVDVFDAVRVLMISGDERRGVFRSESDFLRLALMPYRSAGERAPDAVNLRVVEPDQWPEQGLAGYQVVIVSNVAQLSPERAREIEQFVYGGGGVLITAGSFMRVDDYNMTLFREGSGLLPGPLVALARDASQSTAVGAVDMAHPIFHFLGADAALIPQVTVSRHIALAALMPQARVLARYTNEQPMLVEQPLGRGRVLLLTTSIDADWNALATSNMYLPLMQSAVRYLASGAVVNRTLSPGEPIEATFDESLDATAALIRPRPLGTLQIPLTKVGSRLEARYTQTREPGIYMLRVRTSGGDRRVHFVVRSPNEESDLTPVPRDRWPWIEQALRAQIVEPDRERIAAVVTEARSGRELWLAMMCVVVGLLMTELLLARLWTREVV
jgi:hypothetical protein